MNHVWNSTGDSVPEKNNLVSPRAEARQAELQLEMARTLLSRSPNMKLVLLTSTRDGLSEGKGSPGPWDMLGKGWAGEDFTGPLPSTQEHVTTPPVLTGAGTEPGACACRAGAPPLSYVHHLRISPLN